MEMNGGDSENMLFESAFPLHHQISPATRQQQTQEAMCGAEKAEVIIGVRYTSFEIRHITVLVVFAVFHFPPNFPCYHATIYRPLFNAA